MNPLLENALVVALILGAFGYLLSGFLKKRRAGKGCASDCGCGVDSKRRPAK